MTLGDVHTIDDDHSSVSLLDAQGKHTEAILENDVAYLVSKLIVTLNVLLNPEVPEGPPRRGKSSYNAFIGKMLTKLKDTHPKLSKSARMKYAIEAWRKAKADGTLEKKSAFSQHANSESVYDDP